MSSKIAIWCGLWLLVVLMGCQHISDCLPRKPHQDIARAGFPCEVAPWGHPSDTGNYKGYTVGGGAVSHGDGPAREDGTWGWDYQNPLLPARIQLGWWHGRHEQGGTGAYATDGPRPVKEFERRNEE